MVEIKSVGVVGAGQMGAGIAHVTALAGYDVLLSDVDAGRLDAALEMIRKNLARQVAKGAVEQTQADAALARIRTANTLDGMRDTQLVIEAATEKEEVKTAIFSELTPKLGPDTILASNTSSLSITRLAAATDRPERFIGLHFMNPVAVMRLVEIIRGIATDAATYEAATTDGVMEVQRV